MGLVVGTCLAELGNIVICVDDDIRKIDDFKKGIIPFYEPGLEEMIHRNVRAGRLSFTTDVEQGVKPSNVVFIAVGTPQKLAGGVELAPLKRISRQIARAMQDYTVVVEKSTLPVKTSIYIKKAIALNNVRNIAFDVVCNPEFLREGSAVSDFMKPARIVIGTENERAAKIMTELYESLAAPIIVTNLETAELIKHASNAFLSLRISFINAMANICERMGIDVSKVAEGMGYDKRIGRQFLDAGVGYGGYCLSKDAANLIKIAKDAGYDFELLKVVQKINENQRDQIVAKVEGALRDLPGRTIGILGLSFKPDTDDMREAPSIYIIKKLQGKGAKIKAYDPKAMENARAILEDVEYGQNPYEIAKGSDALVVITEWGEFKNLDLSKVKRLLNQPVIIDGRNIYDPQKVRELGFRYQGVGQ